jgi:CRISPR-associated endonuclease/helicase Cas3
MQDDGPDKDHWDLVVNPLFGAVAGHHGAPCEVTSAGIPLRLDSCFTKNNQDAMAEMVSSMGFLVPPSARPLLHWSDDLIINARRSSWLLAGLVVLADWIGSNASFFPFQHGIVPLEEYWQTVALPRAASAVAACGLSPSVPSTGEGVQWLFPNISQASPLQNFAGRVVLSNGPQLFIVEESTGAGKTEAAVVIAHRLIKKQLAAGLYVGLPTMATANAMFDRLHEAYRRFYALGQNPSIILAHSTRRLSSLFQCVIEEARLSRARDICKDSDETNPTFWLADNRKKALLASVGVGTIDQALLSVLPSRHQSLRLLGLVRSVLIADEVHACDTYMHKLLCALLRFQAALGGSAILLSATLSRKMRQELIQNFIEGAGYDSADIASVDFPLLTHVSARGVSEKPLEARTGTSRCVDVRLLADTEEVAKLLEQSSASGRCACWIRNTVQDAIESYHRLHGRVGAGNVSLFHARFAMGDRLSIETRVLAQFGRTSSHGTRAGRVVVTTQVIEQSVDLDFDVMITDLAPMDLIIQRAGRLCRHPRRKNGDLSPGADERGTPRLCVLAPPMQEEPDAEWYKNFFPRGASVYSNHGQLWLTARILSERGRIRMPEDARDFIEGVFGEGAVGRIPPALRCVQDKYEAERMARASVAAQNVLKLDDGYEKKWDAWVDDMIAPTRLGEDSVTIRLLRWESGKLIPWSNSPENAWQLSDVSVRRTAVSNSAEFSTSEQEAIGEAKEYMPDRGGWCILLPLRRAPDGMWKGKAVNGRNNEVVVCYDPVVGLTMETQ